MLIIWGRLNSHNVKKVAWMAKEAGILYDRRDVGGKFGFPEDYAAKNPNLLIPTIEHHGFILWESNAILRYMAAQFAGELWPTDLELRASADRWMDWQFSYADAQRDAFVHLIRRTPEQRDMAAVAASARAAGEMMAILDTALARHRWLSGDDFGIGDIPMGVYAHSWFTLDIERPARPHVEAWYARLRERPAYMSTVMIPLS